MPPRRALRVLLSVLVAGGLLIARGAAAQAATLTQNDLPAVAPRGAPVDLERDPGLGPRPHEPVFLGPAIRTEQMQFGVSSWITPSAPAERRENPGGLAIGFTIAWPAPRRDVP